MRVYCSRTRIVFVFPLLRLVFKFPNIHFLIVIRDIWRITLRHPRWLLKEAFSFKVDAPGTMKFFLFVGIFDNWREFTYYWSTKHPILQPTYFSLLGLCNVQAYAQTYADDKDTMHSQLYTLTNGYTFQDSHHFTNPANFALVNGKLRILDYGGKRTQNVINAYGTLLWERFDPAWTRQKETS